MHLGKTSPTKNIENLLTYLYNLNRRGIKLGLEHTIDLLKRIENPQNDFKSIHIAGTNGKGSTCSMISSILLNAGYKVGLYSSPHLISFNERIKVNNKAITDVEIASFIALYVSLLQIGHWFGNLNRIEFLGRFSIVGRRGDLGGECFAP